MPCTVTNIAEWKRSHQQLNIVEAHQRAVMAWWMAWLRMWIRP